MTRNLRVLLFLAALPLAAAPPAAGELSLAEAIAIAEQSNFGLEAARADLDTAQMAVRAARAPSLPALSASGSFGTYSGDVLFSRFVPGAPPGGTDVGPFDSNSALLVELSQVLYAGGAHKADRKAGGVEHALAEEELRRKRLDLSYDVTSSFYGVLLAAERIEVARRSVRRSEEGLEIVRRRHAEQEALKVELLGAQSQLAADRLSVLEAENQLELARAELNRLLGRELAAELRLAGALDSPSEPPAEAEGVRLAGATSPIVRQAGLAAERAAWMDRKARSLSRPKLELKALYTSIDNELAFDGDYLGYSLHLSIPFVRDAVAGAAARGQARGRQRHAAAEQQDAEVSMRLAAITAYRRLAEANAAIAVAEKHLEYQGERHRVALSAFGEAVVTFSEVLDEHAELSQAELQLHSARLRARLAEAAVRRVIGLEGSAGA